MALLKAYGSKEKVFESWQKLLDADSNHQRTPFAYRQFARVLDAHGHEREARDVRVEAGHAYTERIAETFPKWRARLYGFWRTILRYLIAYGIKPWRVSYAMGAWLFTGCIIFTLNYSNMTPAKEKYYLTQENEDGSYKVITPSDPLPKGYPDYSPFTYALDVMLPVVDFAQESHWRPKNVDKGRNWLRIFNRIFLAIGWAFSTIAVLGFTGLISDKRDID